MSGSVIWVLAAMASAIVVALHLLRRPAQRVALPSVLLWARALALAPRLRAPWRRWLALALALAIAWALLLGLAGPGLLSGSDGTRIAVVIDTAPSMDARMRDGSTRLAQARAQAAALIDRLTPGTQVALLDTTGTLVPTGFVTPREALAALANLKTGGTGIAAMPPLPDRRATSVHVFTDGVALAVDASAVSVHRVFEPVDNVAITAFDVRALPQQPTRVEALAQVLNASPERQRVRLILRGNDGFQLAQALDLQRGESADVTVDVSAYPDGILAAAAAIEGDGYPADDIAYAVVPSHEPLRVLLVSAGNAGLRDALRSLPGVALTLRTPERFEARDPSNATASDAGRFDAIVFDRVAPTAPPNAPALLMRPENVAWLGLTATPAARQTLLRPVVTHPAVTGVPWDIAPLRALWQMRAPQEAPVLARSAGDAPAIVAFREPVRALATGFAWSDAPATLQANLPVFLGNALRWLTDAQETMQVPPGPVRLPFAEARVVDGAGASVAVRATAEGSLFDAPRPDVFTVRADERALRVVVQPADPSHSQVNLSSLDDVPAARLPAVAQALLPGAWLLLLCAVCVLLVLDWALHARRVTS